VLMRRSLWHSGALGRRSQARPANSRVSVWTLTFSPSLMNGGPQMNHEVSRIGTAKETPVGMRSSGVHQVRGRGQGRRNTKISHRRFRTLDTANTQ
jgi:hypothetical protein